MILVIGATGNTGREVAAQLLAKGEKVRALSRTPANAGALAAAGVEVVAGDLGDQASLARAMSGVAKVYLVTAPDPAMAARQIGAVSAAKAAGVEHIVKVSVLGAAADSPVKIGQWHHESDSALQTSGVAWTLLQPNFFMQNLLGFAGSVQSAGAIYAPAGDGTCGQVDARDIASVAAAALTSPGHEGQTYVITGPAAISFADAAAAIGRATGKPVNYVQVPPEAAQASMLQSGMPEWYVKDLLTLFGFYAQGYMSTVTDVVPRLTGRPARSVDQFAADHAAAFGKA